MSNYNRQKYLSKDLAIKHLGVSKSVFEKMDIIPDSRAKNSHNPNRPILLYLRQELNKYKNHPIFIEYKENAGKLKRVKRVRHDGNETVSIKKHSQISLNDMKTVVQTKNLVAKVIRKISVDSGQIMIGDPLYFLFGGLDGYPKSIGNNWEELRKRNPTENVFFPLKHDSGIDGAGFISRTYWGDGDYPIIGLFNGSNPRPEAIIIDFNNVYRLTN